MKTHLVLLLVTDAGGLGQGWRRQVGRAETKQRRVNRKMSLAKTSLVLAPHGAGRIEKAKTVMRTR